jgi:hypothetical protein
VDIARCVEDALENEIVPHDDFHRQMRRDFHGANIFELLLKMRVMI